VVFDIIPAVLKNITVKADYVRFYDIIPALVLKML
jgi:hypothetical protein